MLGYQPYSVLLREAYKNHIFLSPSVTAHDGDTEGGAPVILIELSATGMPIVSSFHCDIPEVIPHRKSGLLTKERDVDGLAENLLWYINNPEKWEPMTRFGRAHVERNYSAARQGVALAALYADLVHGST